MEITHAGRMTEQVELFRKQRGGAKSPENWEQIGPARRAQIVRISDAAAINEGAVLDANVTHHCWVDYADDYEAQAGSRVLKHVATGENYWIVRVVETGRRQRAGRTRYLRLSLSLQGEAVV